MPRSTCQHSRNVVLALMVGLMTLSACVSGVPATPATKPSAAPGTKSTKAPLPGDFSGKVLDLAGKPAANIPVRGYLVSEHGAGIVSDNGGGIIGNNGSSLIASNSSRLTSKVKRQLLAESLQTRTDAKGEFKLVAPAGKLINVEAVESDEIKAIAQGVDLDKGGLVLNLAYTGRITGQVSAPDAPEVTNFEGVDVYIPGSSYTAKADAAGRFELSDVPPGKFTVVASKFGLGDGRLTGLEVVSKQQTQAPALKLSVSRPVIKSVAPASGGPGTQVVITGEKLGASTGAPFSVSFGGVQASAVTRKDDATIEATVPAGVTASGVTLTVGGVASDVGSFALIKTLSFASPSLVVGLDAPLSIVPAALDEKGKAVDKAEPAWKVVKGEAIAVDAKGKLEAKKAGTATLEATSGSLTARIDVLVLAATPTISRYVSLDQLWTAVAPGTKPKAAGPAGEGDSPYGVATGTAGGLNVWFQPDKQIAALSAEGKPTAVAPAPGVEILTVGPDGMVVGAKAGPMPRNGDAPELKDYVLVDPTGKVIPIRTAKGAALVDQTKPTFPAYGMGAAAVAPDGTIYLCPQPDAQLLYSVTPAGVATLVCGAAEYGYKDGPAAGALFKEITGLAVDKAGNVFIADLGNHRLRKLSAGQVTTIAGQAKRGRDDGDKATATLRECFALAVDAAGNIWAAETDAETEGRPVDLIRVITPGGDIFTVAGGKEGGKSEGPSRDVDVSAVSIAVGSDGNVYFTMANGIYRLTVAGPASR